MSKNGQYQLLALVRSSYQFPYLYPYFLPILVLIAVLSWLLAARIAGPLRHLTRAVEQFGLGDLSARVRMQRKDEFGELSAAFDQMADRISTLLTAERRLLQDASHELRTPLARLTSAAELVRTTPDREMAFASMKKEIHRLTILVGTLIETARSEPDSQSPVRSPQSLNTLLRELVEDCHLEANACGCQMSLQEDVELVVSADAELIRRAFENVLRNAIRHTPKRSSVTISLSATQHGMARIFFSRLRSRSARRRTGQDLLAIFSS